MVERNHKYLETAMSLVVKEPKLETRVACRNLWNLFALDYKCPKALARFSQVIIDAKPEELNEMDIANSLRAFATFEHVDYACLEKLIKCTIIKIISFNTRSHASILSSLADLDIHNPTLLTISKEIIL